MRIAWNGNHMEIGVTRGVRVALTADNEPLCRGGSVEEALPFAMLRVESETGERQEFLRRWVKAANARIKGDELEARVEKAFKREYGPREKYAAKVPPALAESWREKGRNEIRERLKPKV